MRFTSLLSLLFALTTSSFVVTKANDDGIPMEQLLDLADTALMSDDLETAIQYYEQGVEGINEEESLVTCLSMYINLGTAYSSKGDEHQSLTMYRNAILFHAEHIEEIVDKLMKKEATDLAAQASFFLGMSQEELGNYQKAADAYAYANALDNLHWASLANLGATLQDRLHKPAEALTVYNEAYAILTDTEEEPTDPPEEPKFILSQLQYRIGLCITYADKQKCAMQDAPDVPVPCSEMAANAFNLAITLDPNNESAKHMLATVTADATMRRASNTFVTELFEQYAENFEHSLVEELGYNGYERLRRGFDRAFGGAEKVPQFELVVDAGCGTGLVGEQFRNVTQHLVGADLSPSIIEEAKKARPDLYDTTKVGDVTEIFRELKPISMIIAADSYIYFGDLIPLFESMEEGLADGGIAAFTLENVSEEDEKSLNEVKSEWRWQLTPSGRFAHRKEYVDKVGSDHNLKVRHYEPMNGFRKEGANDVRGHIFIMQKQPPSNEEL